MPTMQLTLGWIRNLEIHFVNTGETNVVRACIFCPSKKKMATYGYSKRFKGSKNRLLDADGRSVTSGKNSIQRSWSDNIIGQLNGYVRRIMKFWPQNRLTDYWIRLCNMKPSELIPRTIQQDLVDRHLPGERTHRWPHWTRCDIATNKREVWKMPPCNSMHLC